LRSAVSEALNFAIRRIQFLSMLATVRISAFPPRRPSSPLVLYTRYSPPPPLCFLVDAEKVLQVTERPQLTLCFFRHVLFLPLVYPEGGCRVKDHFFSFRPNLPLFFRLQGRGELCLKLPFVFSSMACEFKKDSFSTASARLHYCRLPSFPLLFLPRLEVTGRASCYLPFLVLHSSFSFPS